MRYDISCVKENLEENLGAEKDLAEKYKVHKKQGQWHRKGNRKQNKKETSRHRGTTDFSDVIQ